MHVAVNDALEWVKCRSHLSCKWFSVVPQRQGDRDAIEEATGLIPYLQHQGKV